MRRSVLVVGGNVEAYTTACILARFGYDLCVRVVDPCVNTHARVTSGDRVSLDDSLSRLALQLALSDTINGASRERLLFHRHAKSRHCTHVLPLWGGHVIKRVVPSVVWNSMDSIAPRASIDRHADNDTVRALLRALQNTFQRLGGSVIFSARVLHVSSFDMGAVGFVFHDSRRKASTTVECNGRIFVRPSECQQYDADYVVSAVSDYETHCMMQSVDYQGDTWFLYNPIGDMSRYDNFNTNKEARHPMDVKLDPYGNVFVTGRKAGGGTPLSGCIACCSRILGLRWFLTECCSELVFR